MKTRLTNKIENYIKFRIVTLGGYDKSNLKFFTNFLIYFLKTKL